MPQTNGVHTAKVAKKESQDTVREDIVRSILRYVHSNHTSQSLILEGVSAKLSGLGVNFPRFDNGEEI